MLVLALDTTTREGSAALVGNARIIIERAGDPARTHAERLPQEILSLAADAGVTLSSVDVFGVASGPGSFTGLRIGIATIQGLAFATGRLVVPISALEALAEGASGNLPPGAVIGVWTDAYRREVFSALYRVAGAPRYAPAHLDQLESASVGDPAETRARWAAQGHAPDLWVGDGARLYAAATGAGDRIDRPTIAGVIGMMASHPERARAAVDPAGIHPLYVRRPDAEVARDRRSEDDRRKSAG
jgi:tRNA threonylcarbamoyladenosine biosynthesis protein TsaB